MRRSLFLTTALAAALALSGCDSSSSGEDAVVLPEGISLVETVEATGDEIVIPYAKYTLDNGLTVVLHEDHSDPLVHVDVTYHVGSAREEAGRSGFAHFFEHMMFQGSENVGDEEHFRIVSESGGTLNGTTNTDRTNYFETVPANQLETMLWLEADRMGFLLPAVTQEKFEVQRETVKNERGQNYDNRPYGLLRERVNEAMYPEGHPYSWLTIGYIEDLNRANLDDLQRFFLRWYGPNNATLTIGGDIDTAQTLEWVNQYFGSIPRGPEVENMEPKTVTLDTDRYISMEDQVSLPLLWMSWPTVHARHPDEAPLDVLMSILGEGRTSLLYANAVRDGLAVQANASHACSELHCQFALFALPNPTSGTSLADLETIMRGSFDEFETRGVLEDDLQRVKSGMIADMIFGLESVRGKVSQLAFYETFTESPDYIQTDIERYRNVTAEDVMRVYNEYIKDKPAVIMSIVPNGSPEMVAAPDTWDRFDRTIPDNIDAGELAFRVPDDEFDRAVQPGPSGANPSVTLPELWRAELPNGVQVLGAVNDEVPTTSLFIQVNAGQDRESMEQLGLASLTAAMMNEATAVSTNEELSNRLALLGSSVNVSSSNDDATIFVRSLTENLGESLELAAERLMQPAFNDEDFARVQGQIIQGIEQSQTQASPTATLGFSRLIFGADNPFAHRDMGVVETVSALSVDDARAFYDTHYSAPGSSIIVVSDLSQDEVMAQLSVFEGWGGTAPADVSYEAFPELNTEALYFIDKPGAAQSEIRIGNRALPFDATGDYYRAGIMNFTLGGAFNSRINLNLREDKGYTYGARSFFSGTSDYGFYRAQAGVRRDATLESIIEFYSEIDGYRENGITDEELAFTRQAIGQSDARRYETPFQKLSFLSNILDYDLPDNFVDVQNDILATISAEEINTFAADLLNTDDMILLVMGDKETVLPTLEELDRPVIELDADGDLVTE